MQGMSASDTSQLKPVSSRAGRRLRRASFGLLCTLSLVIFAAAPGCTEYAHFGQVSDREGSFPVNGVTISQQNNDGTWREVGTTDGKGRWNILKAKIKGGGRIRLQKSGYHSLVVGESDFLQQHNILLESSDSGNFGDGGGWGN